MPSLKKISGHFPDSREGTQPADPLETKLRKKVRTISAKTDRIHMPSSKNKYSVIFLQSWRSTHTLHNYKRAFRPKSGRGCPSLNTKTMRPHIVTMPTKNGTSHISQSCIPPRSRHQRSFRSKSTLRGKKKKRSLLQTVHGSTDTGHTCPRR